jgi:hypothetical protein
MPKPKKTIAQLLRPIFEGIERDALDLQKSIAVYYANADEKQREKLDRALTGLRRNLDDIALGRFDPVADGVLDDQHD